MGPIRRFVLLATLAAAFPSATVSAQGRVDLELAVEERVPITGRQEWLQRLAQAGIGGFRIRSARPSDVPDIDSRGSVEAPVYAVTGIITSNNTVVVPGARFQASQVGQFAAWIQDLAENGPPDERPAKSAFGLTGKDFARLQAEMAPALGFNTQGMSRAAVIRQVAQMISMPLVADPRMAEPLGKDMVAEDLSTLSRGTALAYVLRSPGLCLIPRGTAGDVSLSIVEARPEMEIWPIGWKPEKLGKELKPEMYEFLNVNVSGVPVTKVMEAVGKRLDMPILLDHNAVARHGLDPERTIAELQPSRSTYSIMLRKVLFQARLKGELRVDDADQPFLWVTSVKPL